MKVLFVAGEVAPFSDTTETAALMRALPEQLQEVYGVEPRIVMPRYGVVSERRNRLHEVIRLSGAEIPVGPDTDTLRVKVASIPGIRLQVYFMDSVDFFKRKGLHANRKDNKTFEDNPARALFFARAALSTAHKLGWHPDLVHAAGWIGALAPHVLKTDPDLPAVKTVYTPDLIDGFDPVVSADEVTALGLPEAFAGRALRDIGLATSDAAAYAAGDKAGDGEPDGPTLDGDADGAAERTAALYGRLLPSIPMEPAS